MAKSTRALLPLLLLASSSCASSDPAPPEPAPGPLFTESFDDATPLPREWESARGDLALVAGPSGGRVLRAQATAPNNRGKEAVLHKDLKPTASAKSITCRLSVNLAKTEASGPQSIARLDVGGGAVLFDIQNGAWNVFGNFGPAQQFSEGGKVDLHDRWAAVILKIESAGKIIMTLDNDQRVKHIDVKVAPLNLAKSSIEIGLFAPSSAADTTALFEDVFCTTE